MQLADEHLRAAERCLRQVRKDVRAARALANERGSGSRANLLRKLDGALRAIDAYHDGDD
jgi:hypothetical protein